MDLMCIRLNKRIHKLKAALKEHKARIAELEREAASWRRTAEVIEARERELGIL